MINLTANIQIVDLGLYIHREKALIFSDFHMGYEEMLNAEGVFVPRLQFQDTIRRLKSVFEKTGTVNTVIVNGDLKHEFGIISTQEWREVLGLLDFFSTVAKQIIIVKGNHDIMLDPVARKRNVNVVKEYILNDILISHGDTIAATEILKKIRTVIIGHDHPAVSIREHRRKEMFKCFLHGRWKRKTLIVQPSSNILIEGSDVLAGRFLSPYLQQSIEKFDMFVVAKPGEVLRFGKVKDHI